VTVCNWICWWCSVITAQLHAASGPSRLIILHNFWIVRRSKDRGGFVVVLPVVVVCDGLFRFNLAFRLFGWQTPFGVFVCLLFVSSPHFGGACDG